MGIWSYPIFTNCPDAKVECGWFARGSPGDNVMNHISGFEHDYVEQNKEISLKEFTESIYEHAKIMGHLSKDVIRGWLYFLTKLKEKNPDYPTIEIHLYCKDDSFPYYFQIGENKLATVRCLPQGHIYYSKIEMDEDIGEMVCFDEEAYKRNYSKVHPSNTIFLEQELRRPGFLF